MEVKIKSHLPVVFTDEKGRHIVMGVGGHEIPGIIFTRVHDEHLQSTTVLVKMYCRLATDREDALKMFE